MKRLLILLFVLISLGSFGQGRIVVKVPSVTIPSSLPSQTGNAGKVLTTDGTAAQWTGTARYSFTNLQDGQLIKAQISGGDTTFVNFTPNYATQLALQDSASALRSAIGTGGGSSSGTMDSLRVLSATPATGNIWIDSATGRTKIRDWVHNKIFTVAYADSTTFSGGGGGSNFTQESAVNAALSGTTVSRTAGAGDWDTFVNTGEQLASAGDYLVFYADWGAQVNVGIANNNALVSAGTNGIIPGMDASLTLASDGNLYRDPAVNFADVGDWSAGLWIKILRASATVIEYYRSTDGTTWGSAITTSTISSTNAGNVYASPHTGTIQNFTHN
jgi:hypothetical protein